MLGSQVILCGELIVIFIIIYNKCNSIIILLFPLFYKAINHSYTCITVIFSPLLSVMLITALFHGKVIVMHIF